MAAAPAVLRSPAHANVEGKVLFLYQERAKFEVRYGNLGLFDGAQQDDGSMWATAFVVTELSFAEEHRVAELVRKATRVAA